MRKLLLFFLVVSLAGLGAAEVQYEIDANRERVVKNTTVSLDCSRSCPGLTWTLSEGEEVVSVRDSRGSVDDYTVESRVLRVPGRRIDAEKRVVEIKTVIERDAEEVHAGLYKRTVQLSGFDGEKTFGTVESQDLVSGRVGFGFDMSFSGDEMRFRGDGPVNLRIKSGDGYDTRYFSFFGSRPKSIGVAYEVPVGTTGLVQGFERFPVAVMDDPTYDSRVNGWSSGEYVGGAIQIRSRESIDEDFLPVLAHEVVHGLNDRELNWDSTRSSYFDEGTGKYVEFLVRKKLEGQSRTRELFGDDITYTETREGQLYQVTLPSKGDRETLWNYYRNDRGFMKRWNAMETDPETRRFGYAYSELIIRNYVARMNGSLRQLYDRLEVNRKVNDPEVKWQVYSEQLDMTPCKYESRQRFERCLETINSYDYPVYSAEPARKSEPLEIEKLEVPNRTSTGSSAPSLEKVSGGEVTFREFLEGFLEYLGSLLISGFQALEAYI